MITRKRKRKTPRRKRQHPAVGSAMSMDHRQAPERRAGLLTGGELVFEARTRLLEP